LGTWRNYQDLEESLSMPELLQTIESMQEKERQDKIFLASLQGVDLRDEQEEKGPTFEDIRLKAMGIEATTDDVVSLQGSMAAEAGFGIGAGLGYSKE
jgi:hypothetical protein